MDRQKLSRVVLDHIRERERETTSWSKFRYRLSRSWNRFGALSVWEKSVIAGTAIVVVMAVPAAIFAFSSGGGSNDAPASATVSRRTPVVSEFPTSTPVTQGPTPKPIGIGGSPRTPTPAPSSNREDCGAIAGTPYQSDEERQWYEDNCDAREPPSTGEPEGDNPPPPTAQPPTQPPPTQPPANQGLTAGEAASLGAQFLGVSSGSCSASNSGSYWTVTCGTARACVFENPVLVDYC